MNKFEFGNYLYLLRTKLKISQSQLAEKLGITNKAVSKWENSKSKPSIIQLKKLAEIFDVTLEEMLNYLEKRVI